ncbi:MAG TPA: DNA repair protein RecN [Gemmatimonadales bacterium]|nr:DNA repair protein RecN [Gemmatimonadales bacterium]
MLTELRVRDLAVIADVTLSLGPGLNVLTGETGAGKSMLVDALALLLGERASTDVVRPGAQKTIIEGAFELAGAARGRLQEPLTALGVELEDGQLVLKREIGAEGRSRAWVNGSPTTVGVLAQLGGFLVDLHGQHETQSLLRADTQRDLLDAFAAAEVERVAVRDAHGRAAALAARETEVRTHQDDVRRKADYLRHVVDEIAKGNPKLGEDEALETEARRLSHADELGRLARDLEQAVDAAGLARAAKLLTSLERLDPSTAAWRELLDGAFANVNDLATTAREYATGIDADPTRLAEVERRRDTIYRLLQKYGPAIPDVLAARDAAARELDLLDSADLDLRELASQRKVAEEEFARATAALSAKRERGATRLSRAVTAQLAALGLPGGEFITGLQLLPVPRGDGAEGVAFLIKLNEGLDPRPLARVASGGELSRLMLALKVVLSEHDAVPTLVFDEVDQGIGGEVAGQVGAALATVSRRGKGGERQALVITHLPQIAARADRQLAVSKNERGGVATSDVREVRGEARVLEVARMLGDADSATARRHAEELLRTAESSDASRSETPSPRGPTRPRR